MALDKTLVTLHDDHRLLRGLSADRKNEALTALATLVLFESSAILKANQKDLKSLPKATSGAFRDRLTLNQERINAMVESLCQVAKLADPVGEIIE